jgi:hypothetical protein
MTCLNRIQFIGKILNPVFSFLGKIFKVVFNFFKDCFGNSDSGNTPSREVSPQPDCKLPSVEEHMEEGKRPYITHYDFDIAASQSVVKSFVALVQLYSIIKVLRADTLRDYGAYQLTLIPYALMSFINITSGFVTPSYPAVYMIRSKVMEEAEKRGGLFDGCVGVLDEDEKEKTFFRKTRCEFASPPRPIAQKKKTRPETKGAKFKILLTNAIHQRKKRNIISLGKFWVAKEHKTGTALRSITYFHHLKRSLPLVRFIEVNLKQLQYTISS